MAKHNKLNIAAGESAVPFATNVAGKWADYYELTKPRLLFMVILNAAIGFYLKPGAFDVMGFLICTIATWLIGGGAMALNEYMEWKSDAKMHRTMNRPIPSGRVKPVQALLFGLLLSIAGLSVFAFLNPLSFKVAFFTSLSYLLCYTPLKMKTSLATFMGAIPGALPPLIGWTAAGGALNHQALALFLIVFFWQIPHFLSINWIYRADYERAGFPMLAVTDTDGKMVGRQMVVNMSALLCVSLLPTIFGITGSVYFFSAFLLGISLSAVILFSLSNLNEKARFILRGSIAYLGILFILMAIDKI